MAESDRKRLLDRALALPAASPGDFFGGRVPPPDADPSRLKVITDTALRTKLLDARLAEGLQSPKGPQRIASILRIYPDFDAPARGNVKAARAKAPVPRPDRGLPTVDEMERLIARIRETEANVAAELAAAVDERIGELKRSLPALEGGELERAARELTRALEEKRAIDSQIRHETFKRIERDAGFPPRSHLRFLARV